MDTASGDSLARMTRFMSSMVLMSSARHAPTVMAAVAQMASVPPHAKARPGVGSGISLIFLPPISTKLVSTRCLAMRHSSASPAPFLRCSGCSLISAVALLTLNMVTPSAPAHLDAPRLMRLEPRPPDTMPGACVRCMNDRSTVRVSTRAACSDGGTASLSWCAITWGSVPAETNDEAERVGMESKRPEALSFFVYAWNSRSCSSLKNRSS
mmetsp:Transcript_7132/g.18171  ORF Transcript_7132/g.18171 Transcript_7132/m.18171 type:complete len:211 (-) Transcript_7132:515-1147(-)